MSQKRAVRQQLVMRHAGFDGSPVPMLHSAVPYAFVRGVVDGAVVDLIAAASLGGDIYPPVRPGGKDRVTHVLVVRKNILELPAFSEFMDRYASAVTRLRNPQHLADFMKTDLAEKFKTGDTDLWQKLNVRFTHPLNSRRQG